uniref:G-protein coupled receptors family 1 profile domain-containing protein n=1 Tax=Monopterus albus TaxID=43700 RepID=A0A3Q3JYW1_MONAL|nr:probable G-protein coupled receptor 132 [Monopterus albus]
MMPELQTNVSCITPPVSEAASLTTNESLSTCEPPYNDGRLPLVLLYSVVLVVGLPANIVTVYLTWQQVRRKNVLAVYLWGLAVCDLTYLFTLPLWAHYINLGHRWPWGWLTCKITGYIFFNNMYVSIFLLCCISLDRYNAVVYSLESRGLRRQRPAFIITLTVFLLVAIVHVPVFNMKEGNANESDQRCFEPNEDYTKPNRDNTTLMILDYARVVIGFLIPLLLLATTNRGILANVQRSTGLQYKQKQRVRWLTVAVVVLFLVCFAPYHLLLLVRTTMFHFPQKNTYMFKKIIHTLYTISIGLSTINSAIDPILYVLSSDNIRKELCQGLTQIWARAHPRSRSDSSQNKIQPSKNSSDQKAGTEMERQQGGNPLVPRTDTDLGPSTPEITI